ncbi:class I SAM-dependent methyltransferase [Selenomonadales bacterium OttesenSCG-928-I06]|nr:class I SAM-dependent methyltransferase [Selenomonadales bacterium OttesenSCG-928-I06]
MNKYIVTTSTRSTDNTIELAQFIAQELNVSFVCRNKESLKTLEEKHQTKAIIVVTKDKPTIHTSTGNFFFHLNMTEYRIKNLLNGKHDHMVSAMELKLGMSILDCTLGLATDAIVASYVVGKEGRVVGLESSKLIALIVKLGLSNFSLPEDSLSIIEALRKIEVININHLEYLTSLPTNSFDIVYFDPMFRVPLIKSSNMVPIRDITNNDEISLQTIKEACRVARKKVVLKENSNSHEIFKNLGFTAIHGGKYSKISFGTIDCSKG